MKRTIMLMLLLAACGSAASPTTTTGAPPAAPSTTGSPAAASAPSTTAQIDPWETFLVLAKAQGVEVSPTMTRDDALARALIGCGITWPPKTVDALLAQAYSVQINEAKARGHCSK